MRNIDYKWRVLSCTALGAFISVLDGSTLLIALPTIMKDIKASMSIVTWTIMGYMLVMTILVPSIGRMADMFGRKKLYVSGFIVFTFASLLCSFSQSGMELLLFRMIQAIGGALIVANSTAIVADAFPKRELGKALGINAMVISVAAVAGPIIGGFLIGFGWRYIFYINVPIGIIGTFWAFYQLKESNITSEKQKIDFSGTLAFSIGMLALLTALTLGGFSGWANIYVLILFIASIACLGLFVHIENKVEYPMLDLRLLRTRILAFAFASNFLNGVARGAVTFLLIFYLQGIKGIDPMMAGILLSPFAIALMVAAPLSGMLADKHGSRILSSVGLIISAIGLAGLMTIKVNTSTIELVIFMSIMGIGSGMFFAPNSSTIMGSVPSDKRGIAAGVTTMMNNAGQILSIAISMAIISSSISAKAMQDLFIGSQVGSKGIATGQFISGLRTAFTLCFIFSLLAAFISYLRGPKPTWEKDCNHEIKKNNII